MKLFYIPFAVLFSSAAQIQYLQERRFRNAGVLKTPESTRAPKMGESRITTRAFYKKNTIFPDFGDGMCLRILSTFDSRCF